MKDTKLAIVCIFQALLSFLTPHFSSSRIVDVAQHPQWNKLARARPFEKIYFKLILPLALPDSRLEELIDSISNVRSSTYGHYKTQNESIIHFAPTSESLRVIHKLKAQYGNISQMNAYGDHWSVSLSASVVEELFQTILYHYQHKQHDLIDLVRPEAQFIIPSILLDHVVYFDGLEGFPTEVQALYMQRRYQSRLRNDSVQSTSSKMRLPFGRVRPPYVSPSMIRAQYQINSNSNPTHPQNKLVIGSFLHEYYKEEDLKLFLSQFDRNQAKIHYPSTVGDCLASPHNNHHFLATGEASLDVEVAVALTQSEFIQVRCNQHLRDPTHPFDDGNQEPFLLFMQEINELKDEDRPAVISLSYADDECALPRSYAHAVNREFMKAAMKGITILTSAGDAGVQGSELTQRYCHMPICSQFLGVFPTSSPYVTSVGATTFGALNESSRRWDERVTSTKNVDLITSGGGFSDRFQRPMYQEEAVRLYLDRIRDEHPSIFQRFNQTGRAYPDISAIGHAFPVYVNGVVGMTDGTSVSAPIVASMVIRMNEWLLERGDPMLGFLNPLLYQMQKVCPYVFIDILHGDNACGSTGMQCCTQGHYAMEGWDATSGVGTMQVLRWMESFDECRDKIRKAHPRNLGSSMKLQVKRQRFLVFSEWSEGEKQLCNALFLIGILAGLVLLSVLFSMHENLLQPIARRSKATFEYPATEWLLADETKRRTVWPPWAHPIQ
uniref:subtilisin n=1 Tax=Albugo laibachii Nc14 TaxID=890382 RepID=F0WRC8_9STRA|nr:tripeptidylpeptidase putative [Albugo laibachii Nc14]|eukprot:CCA23891.1 tripeptidylpeptidase putative [Albugo laibachii Nc14]